MKRFLFFVVLGLVVLGYIKTNEFTYLNGELNSGFTATLYAVSGIILVILFLNMFVGDIKRKVESEQMNPFQDL